MFKTKNPVLNDRTFTQQRELAGANASPMTLAGTVGKTGILLLITICSAVFGWNMPFVPLMIGGILGAIVIAFVLAFNPRLSPVLAPVYAGLQGYAVGIVSLVAYQSLADNTNPFYRNAVPIAALATFMTLGVMVALWAFRIVRLSETMRSIIIGATLAVGLTYLVSFMVSLFAPQFVAGLAIFKAGPIGIGFSIFVIILATLNFLVDFDLIERGIQNRAPGYMEWYGGFALVVTIIWLYLEILRLFMKLGNNR